LECFSSREREHKNWIRGEVNGLSPVAVSWNKIDEKTIGSLPQTGDTAKPLLYGLFGLIALVGIGLLIKKK